MDEATETTTLEHGIENSDASTDSSTDTSTGELVLRICSPARRGQIVRLRSRKCTIGSARSCTLRLNARGVQPVHCLIMRGPGATIIRCWTPDTRINGRSFTDANLNVGDRLTIGPIEFEVLNTSLSHAQDESELDFLNEAFQDEAFQDGAFQDGAFQDGALPETTTRFDEDRAGFLEEKDRWERDRDSQRAELDRQREQWQVEQSEQQQRLCQANDDLDSKTAELENQKETLRLEREQLEAQTESLRHQREQWGTNQGQDQSRSPEDNSLLEQGQRELESKRAEFERQTEQWRNECDSQQQRLQQSTEEFKPRIAELEKQKEMLQEQRQEWDAERHETEQRLRKLSEDIDRREASLLDQRTEFDEARAAWETKQQNERDQWEREKQLALKEQQPVAEASMEPIETTLVEPEESSRKEDNGEESLDSYMARLMDRVRTVPGHATAPVTARQSPPTPPSSAKLPSSAPGAAASQSAQTDDNIEQTLEEKLENIAPRGVAPEREMSLSSMRELANVSAQTAINRHAKRQYRHAARSKLLVAGIGLVASGTLLYLWWFIGNQGPVFYAGLVAFMVALFWGFQFAVMSGKVSATNMNAKRLAQIMSDHHQQPESSDQEATDDSDGEPLKTAPDAGVDTQDKQ